MLYRNVACCQNYIMSDHLQSGVPQNLLQGKHITAVDQEPCGKCMLSISEMGHFLNRTLLA